MPTLAYHVLLSIGVENKEKKHHETPLYKWLKLEKQKIEKQRKK